MSLLRRAPVVKSVRLTVLAASLVLIGAAVLSPLIVDTDGNTAAFINSVFASLCHQQPDRCFHIAGSPLAVCGRCLGVISGFFLGALAYPMTPWCRRPGLPPLMVFFLFSLPMGIDVAGNLAGFWISSNILRLSIGAIWGLVLPWYFIPGTAEAVIMFTPNLLQRPRKNN